MFEHLTELYNNKELKDKWIWKHKDFLPPTVIVNDLPIHFSSAFKRIGISMSGGADSTLLAYILLKLITENKIDCKLYPFHMVRFADTKPWLEYIARDVWNWLDKKFPGILQPLEYGFIPSDLETLPLSVVNPKNFENVDFTRCNTDVLITQRFKEYFVKKHNLRFVYSGTTTNPPFDNNLNAPQFREADQTNLNPELVIAPAMINPFALITKDWVMAQYENFQIPELLNLTRSCEADSLQLDIHKWNPGRVYPKPCGECFFCKERDWGIVNSSKYVKSRPCYYALGGLNYKNGYVTSCPTQSDKLSILKDSYLPSEVFNSKNFLQHRLDLLSGKWPKGCDMCKHVEEAGAGLSMRKEEIPVLSHYNKETGTNGFEGLRTVEIRFSHSCNMACLHCSQVFSSGWLSKLKRYEPDEIDRKYELIQLTGEMHRQSPDDDLTISISTERALEIVEDLNANFPNLERVDFAGGEVLYQKQFFPTLERLAQHPNASNMMIMFHSNFNADFDPIRLSKLLANFGKPMIQMSIDSGPNMYSYFRDGNWEKLVENIKSFRTADNGKTEMNLVCTTGTYQIMEIEDIFKSFLQLDANHIQASIIFTPKYLNPALMKFLYAHEIKNDFKKVKIIIDKEHEKRLADVPKYKKLQSFKGTVKFPVWTDIETAYKSLQDIENYIWKTDIDEKYWHSFIQYVKKTDVIWKQSFNNSIKKYKLIKDKIVRVKDV